MDVSSGDLNIMEWDENDVQSWLANLGFPQYESQIKGRLSTFQLSEFPYLSNLGLRT